jgi:hypothetical protein
MKSRWHYTLVAFLFSIIPGLGWLGLTIMGLVTLQLGAFEGFLVLLWCALPTAALAIDSHAYLMLINNILLGSFLVWILALGLRRTGNWIAVIEFSTIMAVIGIILAHIFFPEIEKFWIVHLTKYYQELAPQFNITLDQAIVDQIIQKAAPYLTGGLAAFVVMSALFQLMVSRTMQFMTYRTDKIETSWLNIRFNAVFALIAITVAVLTWLKIGFFRDLVLVVLVPFLVAGLSLIHAFFVVKKISSVKIALFYAIVFLVAVLFWPLLSILICLAMIDSFVNFRSRF